MKVRERRLLAVATMAATVPYLLLKIAWLTSHSIGAVDPEVLASPTYRAANAVTLLLDLAVVGVAAALGWQWGLRLPVWLVLGPMWVATGLLVTVGMGASVAGLLVLVLPTASTAVGGVPVLRPWVFLVVYTGFAVQALLLGWLFVRYLRVRWPRLWVADPLPPRDLPPGRSRRAVNIAAVLLCSAVAMLDGVIAATGRAPITRAAADVRPMPDRVSAAVTVLAAVLGSWAVAVLVRRLRAGGAVFVPLAVAWTGSASMVAWGLYTRAVALVLPAATPSVRLDELEIIAGVLLAVSVAGLLRSGRVTARFGDAQRAHAGQRSR